VFVVIEGGEGSGKSTQTKRLAAHLRRAGHVVVETFESGATARGAAIRRVLLADPGPLDPTAELMLLLADRAQHVAEVIAPALERGATVVCDRFVPSTLAYQGVARGLGVERVERLSETATGGVAPDVVVVLDVTDEVAAQRRPRSRDRMEREGSTFHSKVRAAYRDLATSRGWAVIDANGPVDEVEAAVHAAVLERDRPSAREVR
jgi:dTMP kinase